METILSQKFSYATIIPYKDYSKLSERPKSPNTFDLEEEEIDDLNGWDGILKHSVFRRDMVGKTYELPEKFSHTKRRVNFFYDNTDIHEKFKVKFAYKNPKSNFSFDTTKDHQIKRHFGRPFTTINLQIIERSIRKHGDKVTIKIYNGHRGRMFNSIYFKKSYYVISITLNTKTGNFTIFEKQHGGKKKLQRFVTNSFQALHNSIVRTGSFLNVMKTIPKTSRLYNEIEQVFNDIEFSTKIQEALDVDFGCVNYTNNPDNLIKDLMSFFIQKKQIKIPDGDASFWLTKFYPTEKYLKKNGRKLLAAVLDMLGVKTKITVKMIHLNPDIEIEGLVRFCQLLGSDYSKYIGNLNDEIIRASNRKNSSNFGYDYITKIQLRDKVWSIDYSLNNTERENIIKILNSSVSHDYRGNGINLKSAFSGETFRLFEDHFKMILKIRPYDPDFFMRARTIDEFNEEHRELSKMIGAIKKGWVLEYQYDDETIKVVEEEVSTVFEDNLQTLYPHILKREEEYIEEGSFMHHCVATYADKDKSMIISLRNLHGSDRVTCEFDIQTGRCLQQRHFCNAIPPEYFKDALLLLEDRITKRARWGLLNWKSKEKVPVLINGKPIIPEQKVIRATDVVQGHRLPF